MTGFRLATYQHPKGPRAGLIVGDRLHDAAALTGQAEDASVLALLERWQEKEPLLRDCAGSVATDAGQPLDRVTLLAPILYPPAVYCAGSNYADHVAAMERRFNLPPGPDPRADGGRPFHFLKASRCCVGTDSVVRAPSSMLDWEGELVAVIGREARNVSVAEALDHVAGYMVGNDLSVRDLGFRRQLPATSIFHHSFIDHKSFDRAAPVGPWIVPARNIPDPYALVIRTEVNGVVHQNGSARAMIFSIEEQIAYLSSVLPLVPGDIIMTGTPAGTGAEAGEFLKPGDRVDVSIDGIGRLTTHVV